MKPPALIVDDSPEVARLHSAYLRRLGFEVTSACEMHQAEALLESSRWALLVTDLELEPGAVRDGLFLIQRARQLWPGIRTILVTGWAAADVVATPDGSAVHVLGKPLTFSALAALVEDLVETCE